MLANPGRPCQYTAASTVARLPSRGFAVPSPMGQFLVGLQTAWNCQPANGGEPSTWLCGGSTLASRLALAVLPASPAGAAVWLSMRRRGEAASISLHSVNVFAVSCKSSILRYTISGIDQSASCERVCCVLQVQYHVIDYQYQFSLLPPCSLLSTAVVHQPALVWQEALPDRRPKTCLRPSTVWCLAFSLVGSAR